MKSGLIAIGVGILLPAVVWAARPVKVCPYPDAAAVAAAVAQACPCDGKVDPATGAVAPWSNHGKYTSCVARARNAIRKQGCSVASIQPCAAKSTCGKTAVLCCKVSSTGACTGATDAAPGTCSNDATLPCTADTDCTIVSGPKILTADACMAKGGYSSGTGSACAGCQAAVACCVPSPVAGLPTTCQVFTAAECTQRNGTVMPPVPSCANVTCQQPN